MKKNVIKLNEAQLHQIIAESVKKALKEQEDPDYDPYAWQQEMPMEQPQPAEELNTLQDVSTEIYRTLEGYYYDWEAQTETSSDELLYSYCKKYVALYEQMK